MTNRDNILMPLVLANRSHKVMEQRMNTLSSKLGIEKLLSKYPYQVSVENNNELRLVEH